MSHYSRILIGSFDLLEDRRIDGDIKKFFDFFKVSMLPWDCLIIDHRRSQNMVGTLGTHSVTFLSLLHFEHSERKAKRNLFVIVMTSTKALIGCCLFGRPISDTTRKMRARTEREKKRSYIAFTCKTTLLAD